MDKSEASFFIQQANKDLLSFCVYTDQYFEVNKHHEIIAEKLQAFMEGKIKRLILQTPPRSGKSRLVCEAIAHAMGNLKNTDIIYTGHTISLLEGFSRNIRQRVDSIEYKQVFKNRIKEGNAGINQWSMDNGNQLMIYGVGGAITGKGGHRLIIDDPYATRQDAESETIRKRVIEWYNSTFYSRRHNQDAGICVIMQRWREDDLVGELLGLEDWEVVKIPAIEDGRSFWESRFDMNELEKIRKQIGEYFFMSQYQQDPVNEGGGDFKKEYFEYYDIDELYDKYSRLNIISFLDPAISKKQDGDNTALMTIGVDPVSNLIYLLEIKKFKEHPDEIINEVFSTADTFKNKGASYRMGIEVVQYQKMLALEIQKQMRIRDKFFTLEEVRPQGEKESRIRSNLQGRYSGHTIIHPRYGKNVGEYETELLKFPNGKNDDMIDGTASAVGMSYAESNKRFEIYIPSYDGI